MSDDNLSDHESKAISQSIREELARKRMTRQHLADIAKISLSTVEKALSGQRPFTLATVVRLEEALQLPLRKLKTTQAAMEQVSAPKHLGSYSHDAVAWLEGDYVTIRRSFSNGAAVYVYLTKISWEPTISHLVFHESERKDAQFTQDGAVSVPHQSGYIYLVTNKVGQYRLTIMSRPMNAGEMYGVLTTLQSGKATQLTPVATPIVFVPLKNFVGEVTMGQVDKSKEIFARYEAMLRRAVDEPFVLMLK